MLIFAVLAIDFVVAVLLLPSVMNELRAYWAGQREIAAATKVFTMAAAIVAGAAINLFIMLVVSVMLFLAMFVANAKGRFADLVSSLLVASAPLILERVLRAIAWYFAIGTEAWRRAGGLGSLLGLLGLPIESRALHFFSVFDTWALMLMIIAVRRVSKVGWIVALLLVILVWGSFQALLFQLYLAGYVK